MISFFLTLLRLLRALARAGRDPEFRTLTIVGFFILLSATLFYSSVEGWSHLDAAYFSVMTLATVGYGDLYPVTAAGKVFTIIFVFVGVGVFVVLFTHLARAMVSAKPRDRDDT